MNTTPQTTLNDTLPRDPEKAMMDIISRMTRLIGVYERETQALEESDVRVFAALQEEKLHVATLYESAIRQIMNRRGEIKNISEKIKEQMRVLQQDFDAIGRRNLDALERVGRSTKRLADIMIKSVRHSMQSQNPVSYAHDGKAYERKAGLSIGVNQSA